MIKKEISIVKKRGINYRLTEGTYSKTETMAGGFIIVQI